MRALQRVLERGPNQLRLQQRACQPVVALEEVAVKRAEFHATQIDLPEDVLRLLDFVAKPARSAGKPIVCFVLAHRPDHNPECADGVLGCIELRAQLMQNDEPLSEVWIYRWTP